MHACRLIRQVLLLLAVDVVRGPPKEVLQVMPKHNEETTFPAKEAIFQTIQLRSRCTRQPRLSPGCVWLWQARVEGNRMDSASFKAAKASTETFFGRGYRNTIEWMTQATKNVYDMCVMEDCKVSSPLEIAVRSEQLGALLSLDTLDTLKVMGGAPSLVQMSPGELVAAMLNLRCAIGWAGTRVFNETKPT